MRVQLWEKLHGHGSGSSGESGVGGEKPLPVWMGPESAASLLEAGIKDTKMRARKHCSLSLKSDTLTGHGHLGKRCHL